MGIGKVTEWIPATVQRRYFWTYQNKKALIIQGLFIFKLVEAAGIEPASENLSAEHLHT